MRFFWTQSALWLLSVRSGMLNLNFCSIHFVSRQKIDENLVKINIFASTFTISFQSSVYRPEDLFNSLLVRRQCRQIRSIPCPLSRFAQFLSPTLLGALSLWLPLSAGWYFWTSSLFWHHKHKLLQSFQSARRLELLETESSDCGSRLAANQWQSFGKWSTSGLSWIIKASKWALNLRRCYKSGNLGLFKTLKSKLSNQYSFCFEYVPSWSRNAKIINNRALLKL